jgi:hypothetical protein
VLLERTPHSWTDFRVGLRPGCPSPRPSSPCRQEFVADRRGRDLALFYVQRESREGIPPLRVLLEAVASAAGL